MEAGKRALKCLVISNSQTFLKELSKILTGNRRNFEVRSSNNPVNIKNLIFYHDLAIIEDDYIHQTAETVLADLISFLYASQIKVILLNDFRKKLPEYVARRSDFIRFISKSARIEEMDFVIDEVEYQIREAASGGKSSHDKYLDAIIQIQNLLLSKMPSETRIKQVLQVIGVAAEAGRVAVFENRYDQKGKFLMVQRFDWMNPKAVSNPDSPLFSVTPYHPTFNRWGSVLASGKTIYGVVDKFPAVEQPLLKTVGIRNLLLIPVMIGDKFWGFVMIADTRQQKIWRQEEVPFLKSIISPIASYLEHEPEAQVKDRRDEKLEKILKDSDVGLFIAGRDGIIKTCNNAFAEMTGYKNTAAQNLNLKTITHPDDFAREIPMLKKLLDGETSSYSIEKRFVTNEGRSVWVKLNVSAYQRQDIKPTLIIGLAENITGQKVAEKALGESEDRYKMLSGLTVEGIVFHKQGVAIECNDRMLEISGYTRDEIIHKNLIDLLLDKSFAELMRGKLKNSDVKPFSALVIARSGKKIPVEIENRMVDYHGESLWMTAFRDISDRKIVEQEIRKLNIAINQSPSSILIADKNGKIEYVNQSFCDITGYSQEEVIGQDPSILKSDHHTDSFYSNLWETISKGDTWQGVFKNKTKDGEYFWERAAISPIFDEQKNITHYLAIKENITSEKETREALEESEERHRIIAELTNDFVYSAVIQNNKITINWKSGSLEKLAGYELHEINDKAVGWYSIINEDDLEKIVFPAITNIHKDKVQNFEYRITTKSNKERWVSDKLRLISDERDSEKLIVIGAIQDITPRKSANIALDQSKRYLDSIIDNLPIGLQIFDENGFSARINETQRMLLGLKDIDEGKGSFNILNDPFAIANGSDKVYKEVYDKKTTVNREVELNFEAREHKKGEKSGTVTINEIIFPIVKSDGTVHSVISLTNDITKRVEAENALKASEMHQKALLKVIPDLIFVFTEDGIFKDLYTEDNSRLLHPTGDFLNKSFSEVFPGELGDTFYKYLSKAVETREMQSFNYELVIDDHTFYYETRLLVSKEKEVIAIIRDITDSTLAERSVKDSEEKFRELAERTQDTLILLSASNEILYVSPNLKRIIGISAERYTQNPIQVLRLIHSEDRVWVIPELNRYRKQKQESLDIQFRMILEDGTLKWLWYRENTIFDDDHHPVRYAAVMTDITSNKLSEQQLKEAKEEAEKAYRSKSVFLANISHEIRTPMNAVLGFTELLYSRITDPVLKGYLNSIRSSGNTLLNLLNDILDLSKIEADKMRIILSPVNLFTVFDEIKHIFSLKALEKGLDYAFKIDKNIPASLLLDELRLKQILLNLIDNAIKFTEKGEIIVKAELAGDKYAQSDKVDLLITVEDTGIGVPAHLQESIFESFRQQDDQDKKKYKGTGLGLAITKRLVELFEGQINLKSSPGVGSTFEVVLSDIKVSEPIIASEIRTRKKIRFEEAVLKDKVIVLIDEQKTNRDLIKEVFFHSEGTLIEGENIESILSQIDKEVDLCILEMKSPGSVLEDLILINNHNELKNSIKIGVTSSSDFSLEPKILAAFKTILTKPIQLEGLVEMVDDHFKAGSHVDEDINGAFSDELVDFRILNEVIKLLKGDLHKKWQSSLITSSFSEIEQFAQAVKEVGTEYNLHALNSFSDVLTMHSKNFDIDRMNEVLNSYPTIIKELKGNLKNLTSDN
jgi:PAS domain S-box-containing protein